MMKGFDSAAAPAGISVPGHTVWVAVDRMTEAAKRVESVLAPSFIKKIMGGGSREAARAVVAAAYEESGVVKRTLIDMSEAAIKQAFGLEAIADAGKDGSAAAQQASSQARAMAGTCDRFRVIVDRWRDAAIGHQENHVGSAEQLLSVSKRFQALAKEIRTPASGLRT
jgi:hypothetical protein